MVLHGDACLLDWADLGLLPRYFAMRSRSEVGAGTRRVVRVLDDEVRLRVLLLFVEVRLLVELFFFVAAAFLGILIYCICS